MRRMCLLSLIDEVPARHALLERADVAVVEPAARVVLGPAGGDRVERAEVGVVHEDPGRVAPAMAVDVEGVEHRVAAEHVPGDVLADPGPDGGRVAGGGAPV